MLTKINISVILVAAKLIFLRKIVLDKDRDIMLDYCLLISKNNENYKYGDCTPVSGSDERLF